MSCLKLRDVVLACAVATVLFASPMESKAQVGWFSSYGCCGPSPAATSYARPYAAYRVRWLPSYGISSTCNPWVAGSCGYAVYRPVSAYMPVTACDPSSPCATASDPRGTCVTAYRPRSVPGQPIFNVFRTLLPPYRPRLETVCYTPAATLYAPTTVSYTPSWACPPAGCGVISSGCPTAECAPATTTAPLYHDGPSTTYPSNGAPSTFKQESQPAPEQRLKPTPDASTEPATIRSPRLMDPDSRTAMQPVRRAVLYRAVSSPAQGKRSAEPAVDVSGWRASCD